MKKLSALSLSIATYFTLVPSTFAASISICPPDGQGFGVLCDTTVLNFENIVGTLIQLAFVLAVIIALGFLIWGGIQWILSGGDKGKVESARGIIVAALVGLVLVFLSYFILNIVVGFFTNANIKSLKLPTL